MAGVGLVSDEYTTARRLAGGAPSEGAEFVLLGMPDVNGSIRGKALRMPAFEAALDHGAAMTDLLLGLDPTDAPITDYERFGLRSGSGDLIVHPDQETLHQLIWRPGWSICLATPMWRDGEACNLAPREVLRTVLGQMTKAGYDMIAAFEYEVRLRDAEARPVSSGISYSLNEIGRFEALVGALAPALDALGVELTAVHTEAGPGLLELNIGARTGLQAADDALFVKYAVKDLAASMGLRASFLAKTTAGEEGSSGHVHMSCWTNGSNAFAPKARDELELPSTMTAAIAGVVEHLPATSLLLNPNVNSYKRLVPGWFAPVNQSWGIENRTAAVRAIPNVHADLCRIECRRPGADANPYLALAGLGASAFDGIQRGATPPAAVEGDAYTRGDLPELPGSLESALREFADDPVLRTALGEEFGDYYVTSREWELKAWRGAVTDWERERYERSV
jgi:glutamine synthetase